MDPTHEADLKNAFASVESNGIKAFPVVTSDPDLPWVVFRFPSLGDCDAYASRARTAPISAAVHLFRICVMAHPAEFQMEQMLLARPFVAMRAVGVLLSHLGLAARAEKKSLI